MRNRFILVLTAIAFSIGGNALALNVRSAVSVSGLDTNPCTPASPCRSFTAAMGQTNPGGEIVALTTAGYGPFTINQPVTVSGAPGIHAAITATSGDAITINASGQLVIVRNLVLIGGGTAANGIDAVAAADVRIIGCVISGFTTNGILVAGGNCDASVDETYVLDNITARAIAFLGTGPLSGAVTRCKIDGNDTGVWADSQAKVVVANSTITGEGGSGTGVRANSTTGTGSLTAQIMVENSVIAHTGIGVSASAGGGNNTAVVTLSQNILAFNTASAIGPLNAGAAVNSFGNNQFVQNTADGAISGTLAFK